MKITRNVGKQLANGHTDGFLVCYIVSDNSHFLHFTFEFLHNIRQFIFNMHYCMSILLLLHFCRN